MTNIINEEISRLIRTSYLDSHCHQSVYLRDTRMYYRVKQTIDQWVKQNSETIRQQVQSSAPTYYSWMTREIPHPPKITDFLPTNEEQNTFNKELDGLIPKLIDRFQEILE